MNIKKTVVHPVRVTPAKVTPITIKTTKRTSNVVKEVEGYPVNRQQPLASRRSRGGGRAHWVAYSGD